MAIRLLRREDAASEVATRLANRFHLSTRQAYRYVRAAQETTGPLPVPETKAVFTVKLPKGLIVQVRRRARQQGREISQLVAQALKDYLEKSRTHGQAQSTV